MLAPKSTEQKLRELFVQLNPRWCPVRPTRVQGCSGLTAQLAASYFSTAVTRDPPIACPDEHSFCKLKETAIANYHPWNCTRCYNRWHVSKRCAECRWCAVLSPREGMTVLRSRIFCVRCIAAKLSPRAEMQVRWWTHAVGLITDCRSALRCLNLINSHRFPFCSPDPGSSSFSLLLRRRWRETDEPRRVASWRARWHGLPSACCRCFSCCCCCSQRCKQTRRATLPVRTNLRTPAMPVHCGAICPTVLGSCLRAKITGRPRDYIVLLRCSACCPPPLRWYPPAALASPPHCACITSTCRAASSSRTSHHLLDTLPLAPQMHHMKST
jgi:hypothetical protein